MILTQCAVCATELGLTLGKKCGRCSTRYCGPECQVQHWKEGGHDKLCKKIKKAGGAEQFTADKRYAQTVAVAVEKCADDTKGQTCYICTEAVHRRTGEGLVRGCACHTTEGFVHVSCLAEQAKILHEEVEEKNLGDKAKNERWMRWAKCSLCKQDYHGIVWCALGWACWKTYVGRPETDETRRLAMNMLGLGLYSAGLFAHALSVQEAELSMMRRLGAPPYNTLAVQVNLARTYHHCGRAHEALRLERDVYSDRLKLSGGEHEQTLVAAMNYAGSLVDVERYAEARSLMHKTLQTSRRVLGERDSMTLRATCIYATTLYKDDDATLDDLREAVTTLEEMERTARRVLGGAHPMTAGIELHLRDARAALSTRGGTG